MEERRQGFGNKMNPRAGGDQRLEKTAIESRCDRKQKLVLRAQPGGRFQHHGKIHAYFFHATARHESDPRLGRVHLMLRGVVVALDRGQGLIAEGMANKGRIHSMVAIEPFFKWKNH